MSIALDKYFVIRAIPHAGADSLNDTYVLFSSERKTQWFSSDEHWTCKTIENSSRIIGANIWKTDGQCSEPRSFTHYRKATEASSGEFWKCTMTRREKYVDVPNYGRIHLWEMTQPNTILPPAYYHVCAGKDISRSWHFKISQPTFLLSPLPPPAPSLPVLPSPPSPPTASTSTHKHVVHGFMELAIMKKEDCPILMEPLTQENIAYTSCGHLFSAEAILRNIRSSGCCATCRGKLSAADIYRWQE